MPALALEALNQLKRALPLKAAAATPVRQALAKAPQHFPGMEGLGRDTLTLSRAAAAEAANLPVNFAKVSPGLYRGGAFSNEAQFLEVKKRSGFTRIVSLLDPTNPKEAPLFQLEQRLAAKHGVEFHHVQLPFGQEPPARSIAQILELTGKASDAAPVYLHCRIGRDRTGTMVAVHRIAHQGHTADQAIAEMRSFGYNPERDTFLAYLKDFVQRFAKRQPAAA